MSKPIGSDFDLTLDTEEPITGYSALKLKYQKPSLPGETPVEGFLAGESSGTGTLKIKSAIPHSLWDTEGDWEFITWVEFADGRILKGEKPFILTCTSEF